MNENEKYYSYDFVYNSTLEYFNGDDLATNVWISKYCKKKMLDDGKILYYELTPDDMFHRIAKEIARVGMKYENPLSENFIYELIKDFRYIVFQGRPMAGIGIDDAVSISNCFVVGKPEQDSYGTIALIDQQIMQLSKRGGGVGTDLSGYRPNGAKVNNAAMTSSGPVEICANRFSNTIREVGQNGRRGALMLSIDVTHPSAEEFIDSKLEEGKITGANISVKLYDDWINKALGLNEYKIDEGKYKLWKKIIHNATVKAEPGVLFWDTVLRESVADCYKDFGFKTISTNPCFPGSEMLLTDNGYFSFKELYDKQIPVKVLTDNRVSYIKTSDIETPEQWHIDNTRLGITVREASNVFKTKENAEIIKLYFANGKTLRCTPDHHIATRTRGMIEAKDLIKDEEILIFESDYMLDNKYTKFIKYENDGIEDVYCIKEPITRSIIVNGFVTRRCGEITLSDSDSCRLMAINLYSYVINPFTSDAYFDYDLFSSHVRLMTKMMDNMIDLELEKINKIIHKVENDPEDEETKAIELNLWKKIRHTCELGRRAGIGITAEGDMLAAMGYKYGTPTATEFATNIQQILTLNVYIESCDLVQIDKRPRFECYNYTLERNNQFLNRLANIKNANYNKEHTLPLILEFRDKWKHGANGISGRRNISCLTVAPTGSVSCLTQTTSGIEPVFKVAYTRRRKIDKSSGIKPDFIDKTGDWFINFNVVHNKFIVWYSVYKNISFNEAKNSLEQCSENEINEIIKLSPYYQATAMDCDWKEKVKMQGKLQKYIDHSISVTINLPKGTTEETVSELYKTAWESGCKGCTIYVDGSRDGILISNTEKEKTKCKEFLERNAPKRPKKLPCKIVRFTNKGEKWIAAVGLLDNHPYEIFSGLAEKLNIPTNATEIFIVRNKISTDVLNEDTGAIETRLVSRYDIEYIDINRESKLIEGLSTIFNKEYWNYGKLISGLLRHSMPISYVIKVISSLDFKDDGINSWKNGVIRALKQFTKDEELGDVCPNCGEKLWRVSGCIECKNCGYSKCG